jgi:hypothetical protein
LFYFGTKEPDLCDHSKEMPTTAESGAQLPTYEALHSAHQPARLTDAAQRLLWTLQGPLSTSIMVMAERQNPDSARDAYF